MNKRHGSLIAFSGLDGAGKSTQINLLIERLRAAGHQPVYLWTRGGYTNNFNALKSLLRRVSRQKALPPSGHSDQRDQAFAKGRVRKVWLWLAILDLIWVYTVQVRWLRWLGRTVICDRYIWDTLVDFRLSFAHENVERWGLWSLLVRLTPKPDASFLLLVPVTESMRRSDIKGEPYRDPQEVLADRLAQYQLLAQQDFWHVLDGLHPAADLAAEIWEQVYMFTSNFSLQEA